MTLLRLSSPQMLLQGHTKTTSIAVTFEMTRSRCPKFGPAQHTETRSEQTWQRHVVPTKRQKCDALQVNTADGTKQNCTVYHSPSASSALATESAVRMIMDGVILLTFLQWSASLEMPFSMGLCRPIFPFQGSLLCQCEWTASLTAVVSTNTV